MPLFLSIRIEVYNAVSLLQHCFLVGLCIRQWIICQIALSTRKKQSDRILRETSARHSHDHSQLGLLPSSFTANIMVFKVELKIILSKKCSVLEKHVKIAIGLTSTLQDASNYSYRNWSQSKHHMNRRQNCTASWDLRVTQLHGSKKQESCAITGRTARCRCKFRYVSNFYRAMLRLCHTKSSVCLSVCLSVRLSVTLRYDFYTVWNTSK